ncbi:MAG: DUF3857 and transglutaminase domain-containing protein [Pyrinomonadaceae bacterium]|nr:DUF3857 and transglutaminase domain-containing protein [Pyrinomonadaceae bacterium]
MFRYLIKQLRLLWFSCLFLLVTQNIFGGDEPWRPVSPAERQMTASSVESGADAEILFWEVRLNDATQNLIEENYVRIKVFTEKGREKYSKVDIPYLRNTKIKDVSARVIRPDGSIVEIGTADIFEREIVRDNDEKVKATSFAIPNIEPGVIIEYRYKEIAKNTGIGVMPIYFQRDTPIRTFKFYLKPWRGNRMRWLAFNAGSASFVEDEKGYYLASMANIPSFKSEPYMPPSDQVRSWMLIFPDNGPISASTYWGRFSGIRSEWYKAFEPKKDIKKLVPELIANANSDEEKISRIFNFCKTQIRNLSYDPTLSREQRAELADGIDNAKDALAEKRGNSVDINTLFGAMVTAAGFEARYVYTGNRSRFFFNPELHKQSMFVHLSVIAVKVGNGWRFYDPGSYFIPEGMLQWHDERESALLIGKKDYIWSKTPLSPSDKTAHRRNGRFKLDEEGTLEGIVSGEYTGHLSEYHKLLNYDESQNQREERLIRNVKASMPTAEVTGIKIENANDPEKPFTYEYLVRVPNYAQKTGKRMFMQPGVFEANAKPVFSASTRVHDIYFSYPWEVHDNISIQYPESFELDNPDVPAEVSDPRKIGVLNISIGHNPATRTLYYKRDFQFGSGESIQFPAAFYSSIKNLFDGFHRASAHSLSLRQK